MKLLYITQMYPSKELPQYCVFLHLQVKALIKNGVEIVVVIPTAEAASRTVYDGVEVVYLHFKDVNRSALYGLTSSRLYKSLRDAVDLTDFDAVYAIHAQANILHFARTVARRIGKPLAVHYRGYNIFQEYTPEPKVFLSNNEKVKEKVVKASAVSIGVSKKVVEIITDRFPEAPVAVVYNGVDKSVFSDGEPSEAHDDIRILCVANLIPIKGHRFLFNAVKAIREKNPDLKLSVDVVGRGPLENELKEYVREHHISDVRFHGYVPHESVSDFMRETDIFTLPSVYEAFGNVCLESMACKKPIVIFEGQGIDELIEDGVSGMIAEKGNQTDYTEKLEKLVKDKELRRRIAKNGFSVAQQYTWDQSAKDIIRVFGRILNHG